MLAWFLHKTTLNPAVVSFNFVWIYGKPSLITFLFAANSTLHDGEITKYTCGLSQYCLSQVDLIWPTENAEYPKCILLALKMF